MFALIALAVFLCPGVALAESTSEGNAQATPISMQATSLQVQNEPSIELTRDGEDKPMFSDGTAVFRVSVNGLESGSYTMHAAAGQFRTFNDETRTFSKPVPENAFSYNQEAGTITINGAKLKEGAFESCFIIVRVWASDNGNGNVLAEGINGVEYREARVDYDFNDMDECDMLRGWEKTINRFRVVRVENSQFPDGKDSVYEVTNVVSDNDAVLKVEQEFKDGDATSEDYWWRYRAVSYGDANVTVTYKDPAELGGGTKTRVFAVHVTRDVYRVNVDVADGGSNMALPGRSITLVATGNHEIDYDRSQDDEALSYEWELLGDGANYATLAVDQADPAKATVAFRELTDEEAQNQEVFWRDVRVQVTMKGKHAGDAEAEERARNDIQLTMSSDYHEVWAKVGETWSTSIDGDLDAGCSVGVEPALRHYAIPTNGSTGDFTTVDNAKFRWFYDKNAVRVADASGTEVGGEWGSYDQGGCQTGAFTITRLPGCDWDTDIALVALFDEQEGQEPKTRMSNYHLNGKNYDDLWFEAPTDKVYRDGDLSLALRMDDNIGITPTFTVSAKEVDEGAGEVALVPDTHYTVDAGNKTVTLKGQALRDAKVTKVAVKAELKVAGSDGVDVVLGSEERDFEVRDVFVDYHLPRFDSLLIGWDNVVDNKVTAYVENTAHPNGEDVEFSISNVSIQSQTPREGASPVITLKKEYENNDSLSSNYWWRYTAEGYGTANLEIAYTDLFGQNQTHVLAIDVSSDVYRVGVESETGFTKALPGETIELVANGVHEKDDSGSEGETLSYEWELLGDGTNYATLTVDQADPAKATITFRELTDEEAQNEEGIWQDVRVRVIMKGKRADDAVAEERARDEITLILADSFAEVLPTKAPRDLGLLCEMQTAPALRIYSMDDDAGFETVDNVTFHWSFDDRALQITDSEGQLVANGDQFEGSTKQFSIKRITNWGTDVMLSADWTDEDGNNRHDERTLHFDRVEPIDLSALNLGASFDRVDGFVDSTDGKYCVVDEAGATITPDLDIIFDGEPLPKSAYEVCYQVLDDTATTPGHPVWIDYGSNNLSEDLIYRIVVTGNEDNGFFGQRSVDGWEFWVVTKYVLWPYSASFGEQYAVALEAWPWVRYDIPYGTTPVLTLSSPDAVGGQALSPEHYTVSWHNRTVSPDTIYDEDAHAAAKLDGVPTDVGQYYCYYEGKDPYKEGGVVLFDITPKSIANAVISGVSDKTYTGSPITQAVTVKVDGVTLTQGSDYSVAYANNTNAGTATMTVSGVGNYTGKVAHTFRISASTLTPAPTPEPGPTAAAPGTTIAEGANVFSVTVAGAAPEVAFVKGGTAKSINVPATIQSGGVTYAVTSILKSAGKGKKKLKSFTIGENVVKIDAKTCKDAKKLTKVTVKSGKLTKKAIKNLLKGSKIKTIKLSGQAAKAMKKQYQKWAGKKAKVK